MIELLGWMMVIAWTGYGASVIYNFLKHYRP